MGAGSAASVSFVIESGVGVGAEDHVACLICDAVVGISGAIIEQVMDDFFCFFSCVCLTSGDGVEGS